MPRTKLHHVHVAPEATRVQFTAPAEMTWRGDGGSLPLKREVTRRIAVCWNALEGIPTEALERGMLREVFEAIAAGDLARAQHAASAVEAAVELTNEDRPHVCGTCS